MLVSLNFLKRYVDLEGISPRDISEALISLGLEVESAKMMTNATNVITAKVVSKEPHPDADKLNICKVDFGEGEVQVVCGAKNVDVDQIIIFAKPGAVLANDFKIKKSVIRGIESNGMICSLGELGIEDKFLNEKSKNGIEVLKSETPIGIEPLKHLKLNDVIFDISLTPNRADCYAITQIAIELSAYFKRKMIEVT